MAHSNLSLRSLFVSAGSGRRITIQTM